MKEPITTLGQIIDGKQQRDAIHIAIAPVKATVPLAAGDCIDFASKENRFDVVKVQSGGFGIVDPFLTSYVMPGQWFWAFLRPNTVTGMRHEWQHPAFSGQQSANIQDVARAALTEIAEEIGGPFGTLESLIAHVESCMEGGEHYVEHGHEHMRSVWYENEERFWVHYEALTGKKKPDEYTPIFCCTC